MNKNININYIKLVVDKALEAQFSIYSWENMIDDCDLDDEEKKWAKENLTYKTVEVSTSLNNSSFQEPFKQILILCLAGCDYKIEVPNYFIQSIDFNEWEIEQKYLAKDEITTFTLVKRLKTEGE